MVQYPFPIPNGSPFPGSNIPFGIFHNEDNLDPRAGTAVGDHVLDLRILIQNGLPLDESIKEALASRSTGQSSLNAFAALAANVRNTLRKATATSISPWIVTVETLEEAGALLTTEDLGLRGGKSTTIPFLRCQDGVAVRVSTSLSRNGVTEDLLGRSDLKNLHWSPFQMVAHHSSSGCGLEIGDLLGTGTLSSSTEQIKEFGSHHDPTRRSGCLAELVLGGTWPFTLSNGSELGWLEDGDIVTMEGWAGSGDRVIGFGGVSAKILPAKEFPWCTP
ncbi:fumarylacetoacetate hydrolase [Fusarium agapanthi]|uniref:Fumarylacetoacetase n=1 Tax=Fusarium agapanthi TaxID=1803897 RepID=A0A9P5BDK4_9HYPO|nr:fumarylacetoacetate hydrolase [Fusarium agapanthi]